MRYHGRLQTWILASALSAMTRLVNIQVEHYVKVPEHDRSRESPGRMIPSREGKKHRHTDFRPRNPRTHHETLATVSGTTLVFWKQSGQTDHVAPIHFSSDLHYQKGSNDARSLSVSWVRR